MSYGNTSIKETPKQITPEYILNRINPIDIFERFLGIPVQFETQFVSPIRTDDSPGCKFWISDSTGRIKYLDKAKKINEDCFGIIKLIHPSANFDRSLRIIAEEFGLIDKDTNEIRDTPSDSFLTRGKKEVIKVKKKITVQAHSWQPSHIKFWKNIHVTGQIIKDLFIYPAQYAYINNKLAYKHSSSDIAFVYYFPDNTCKLYFPNRKAGEKFITDSQYLQGYNVLPAKGETLIITKSYKDIAVLRKLGFPAVAPQSEASWMSDEIFEDLKRRFDNIYILYDNDTSGYLYSETKCSEYSNLIPIFYPEDIGKDSADVIEECGEQETAEILNYMIYD